jgi:hypothetical protein
VLPIVHAGKRQRVLVYVARVRPRGQPRPGYLEIVVQAARELELPANYIASLQHWLPKQARGAGHRGLGEFNLGEFA